MPGGVPRNCVHDRPRVRRTAGAWRTFCPRPRCHGAASSHRGGATVFRCADARASWCGARNAQVSYQIVDASEMKLRAMEGLHAAAKIAAARHRYALAVVGRGGTCRILSACRNPAADRNRGARGFAMVFPHRDPADRHRRAVFALGEQTVARARADRSPFETLRRAAHMPACRRISGPQSAPTRVPRLFPPGGGYRSRSADGDLRDGRRSPCQMPNKASGGGIFRRRSWKSGAFRISSLRPCGRRSDLCRHLDGSAFRGNHCVCRDRGA